MIIYVRLVLPIRNAFAILAPSIIHHLFVWFLPILEAEPAINSTELFVYPVKSRQLTAYCPYKMKRTSYKKASPQFHISKFCGVPTVLASSIIYLFICLFNTKLKFKVSI